jgi:hypothetical protein
MSNFQNIEKFCGFLLGSRQISGLCWNSVNKLGKLLPLQVFVGFLCFFTFLVFVYFDFFCRRGKQLGIKCLKYTEGKNNNAQF